MPRFTWGDSVRVKAGAPSAMRPGAQAAVCAITEIENDTQSKEYGAPIGSTVYLIEFSNGDAIELAEMWIETVA